MDKPTREGIEACRPASEDLQSPDLAELAARLQDDPQARLVYERVQQFDAAIVKSIDDVAVPPGLAERILERLQSPQDAAVEGDGQELLTGAVAAATEPRSAAPNAQVSPARRRLPLSRRHLTGAALTAVLACVLVVVVFGLLNDSADVPLAMLAEQWQAELGGAWQKVADAPAGFDVPTDVRVTPARWQWINRFSRSPVVAYELVDPKAGKAMLYVADMSRAGLRTAPPIRPDSDTGGRAVAWWQSGSRVYVLVVEDKQRYRDFVRPSTTPLA